ncbi:hypothetical protein ACX1HF_03945 [Yersinia pseudotuberculosis]
MLSKEEIDRQDFEVWYTNMWHPLNMKRNRFDNYIATDHTMAWEGWQARSAELLSLREQLAEQREPFGYISSLCVRDIHKGNSCPLYPEMDEEAGYVIPLFTAAKQADSVTLPAPANYEDYGPMVSLEKTMAALALCGIEYTVKK